MTSTDGLEDYDLTPEAIPSAWQKVSAKVDRPMQTNSSYLATVDPTKGGQDAKSALEHKQFLMQAMNDTQDQDTQTEARVDAGTQTEAVSDADLKMDGKLPPAACELVLRSAPIMFHYLERNLTQHAFDEYNIAPEERDSVTLLHSLSHQAQDTKLKPDPKLAARKGSVSAAADARRPSMLNNAGDEKRVSVSGASSVNLGNVKLAAGALLSCSDVSWSASGSVVACAYGRMDHSGWCNHRSYLCCWNIMRRQIKADQADIAIELPCCLMCLDFHPERPTVIVGGLFNGEVRVWDIANVEEPQILCSPIDDFCHREPVSRVAWVRDLRDKTQFQIVSISGDGKVLFWSEDNKMSYPRQGAAIVPNKKYHGQGLSNRSPVIGGAAMAFSSLDYSNYVIGTEGGGVLKCLQPVAMGRGIILGARAKQYDKHGEFSWAVDAWRFIEQCDPESQYEVKRVIERYAKLNALPNIEVNHVFAARPDAKKLFPQAVNFAFEAHAGPVYSVACSPFHRNIFLSCSTDGTVRVYNMLRAKPLLSLEPAPCYLYSVAWSAVRPLVFAVGDGEGKIHVYDLQESMHAPVIVVPSNADKAPVHALKFNAKDTNLLASVDAAGRLAVWQLSERLASLQKGEATALEQMGAASSN